MRAMEEQAPGPEAGLRVGVRVVVRHRLDRPDPLTGATLTDVVGDLVALDATLVVVATRTGRTSIPRASITAAKEVPPRPSRRGAPHRALSVEDLQRVMVGAWPAMETAALGDWLLRASRGFTQRANSVMTAGDPGRPLVVAVDAVEAWYAARGLPANVTVAGPVGYDVLADPLGAELTRRGYTARVPTMTLTAPTRLIAQHPHRGAQAGRPGVAGGQEVEVGAELTQEWLAAYRSYRDVDEVAARAVLAGSPRQVFASALDDGDVVGIGRLGVSAGWGGIAAMWVAPRARRAGVGTLVLRALAVAADALGAASLHLQTDSDNPAALGLYEGHGFERHHAYVNLTSPGADRLRQSQMQVTSSSGS